MSDLRRLPNDVTSGLQAMSQGKSVKVVTIGDTVQIRGSDTGTVSLRPTFDTTADHGAYFD